MRKCIWMLVTLCVMMPLFGIRASATEASGEAVVGYDVGEDSIYHLNVQVIGYGFVLDGRQRIQTSVTYEVSPGIVKAFILEPEEGYRIKSVWYEKPELGYKEEITADMKYAAKERTAVQSSKKEITADLQERRVEIPTESTEMKLTVVYEKIPVKKRNLTGSINTGDGTNTVPYLILMLAALLVLSQRGRTAGNER